MVNIQNIIEDNNFTTPLSIKIKKNFYEFNIQNIIMNNATHSLLIQR